MCVSITQSNLRKIHRSSRSQSALIPIFPVIFHPVQRYLQGSQTFLSSVTDDNLAQLESTLTSFSHSVSVSVNLFACLPAYPSVSLTVYISIFLLLFSFNSVFIIFLLSVCLSSPICHVVFFLENIVTVGGALDNGGETQVRNSSSAPQHRVKSFDIENQPTLQAQSVGDGKNEITTHIFDNKASDHRCCPQRLRLFLHQSSYLPAIGGSRESAACGMRHCWTRPRGADNKHISLQSQLQR